MFLVLNNDDVTNDKYHTINYLHYQMIIDQFDRASGRTTRLVLDVARSISAGENILVVCHSTYFAIELCKRVQTVLSFLVPNSTNEDYGRTEIKFFNGRAKFAGSGNLEHAVKGQTFTKIFVDGGELDIEESKIIAPVVKSSTWADINYIELDDQVLDIELNVPKEQRDRRLSSR